MGNREGVIRFSLDFQHRLFSAPGLTRALTGWRHVLYRLGLIGCDPLRYQGYGFGNISCRYPQRPGSFIITGSQTGEAPFLADTDYALVTGCDPLRNAIRGEGLIKPSSEALTHGQLYLLDETIGSVVHVHCPEIWRQVEELQLPVTAMEAAYGTPEMAREVERIFALPEVASRRIFVMGGHEDGVVGFGRDLEEACTAVIVALARAVAR